MFSKQKRNEIFPVSITGVNYYYLAVRFTGVVEPSSLINIYDLEKHNVGVRGFLPFSVAVLFGC